jgi:hypothetical protein
VYAGELLRSGATAEAFPMPLGSEADLGLAGPYGTPLIAEGPAPAEPAGGVNWAKACPWIHRLPNTARTSADVRNIGVPPDELQFYGCRELCKILRSRRGTSAGCSRSANDFATNTPPWMRLRSTVKMACSDVSDRPRTAAGNPPTQIAGDAGIGQRRGRTRTCGAPGWNPPPPPTLSGGPIGGIGVSKL